MRKERRVELDIVATKRLVDDALIDESRNFVSAVRGYIPFVVKEANGGISRFTEPLRISAFNSTLRLVASERVDEVLKTARAAYGVFRQDPPFINTLDYYSWPFHLAKLEMEMKTKKATKTSTHGNGKNSNDFGITREKIYYTLDSDTRLRDKMGEWEYCNFTSAVAKLILSGEIPEEELEGMGLKFDEVFEKARKLESLLKVEWREINMQPIIRGTPHGWGSLRYYFGPRIF